MRTLQEKESNSVSKKQSMIHPLSRTGEANIAYERQIAGKTFKQRIFEILSST